MVEPKKRIRASEKAASTLTTIVTATVTTETRNEFLKKVRKVGEVRRPV